MTYSSPNFFILGAPKCGTTSLARWLSAHPNVYMPVIKEPHYFSTDLSNRTVKSARHYQELFKRIQAHHTAIGEASTWYLYSREAVANIERECAAPRYIVMTRDPINMAHSLYNHNVKALHENADTFEKAWNLQKHRRNGNNIPRTCREAAFLQYGEACAVGTLIDRLLHTIPIGRVLHVALDDMKCHPEREYKRVLAFLNIPDDRRNEFPIANKARIYRSRLLKVIIRMSADVRIKLGISRSFGLSALNEKALTSESLSAVLEDELEQVLGQEREILANVVASLSSG